MSLLFYPRLLLVTGCWLEGSIASCFLLPSHHGKDDKGKDETGEYKEAGSSDGSNTENKPKPVPLQGGPGTAGKEDPDKGGHQFRGLGRAREALLAGLVTPCRVPVDDLPEGNQPAAAGKEKDTCHHDKDEDQFVQNGTSWQYPEWFFCYTTFIFRDRYELFTRYTLPR